MPEPDFIGLFTEPLERLKLGYMITGATAAIVYGQPRVTNDLDLVIELSVSDIERLRSAFAEDRFYVPPGDVIAVEVARAQRGHLNIIHYESGYKADLYTVGSDPLHIWAMARRRRIPRPHGGIDVAPPEYVILRKLEYFREGGSQKHLTDIKAIMQSEGSRLDQASFHSWLSRQGLTSTWDSVFKETD